MNKYDKSWNFDSTEDSFWKTIGIGALNVACLAMIVVVGILIWAVLYIPE